MIGMPHSSRDPVFLHEHPKYQLTWCGSSSNSKTVGVLMGNMKSCIFKEAG